MRKIIVFTLLLMFVAMPVFAGTDWEKFESGGGAALRLTGYQGQPAYIEFQDGDGTILGYLYWNETANKVYVITPDEWDMDYPLGIVNSAITTNIGIPLKDYTGSGLNP